MLLKSTGRERKNVANHHRKKYFRLNIGPTVDDAVVVDVDVKILKIRPNFKCGVCFGAPFGNTNN